MTAGLTVAWFGCTTFRIVVDGLTLWFDTYVDRAPGAEPVGLASREIDRADFVFVSHAHFDHVLGADTVAANTGAPVIGSYETARVLRSNGVADAQLWPVSGGETIACGEDVRVRVFPSLHSCLFAASDVDGGAPCVGDLGVSYQRRREVVAAAWGLLGVAVGPDYARTIERRTSAHDGGQLSYLLETRHGSVLVSASSGAWTGIIRDLRPDVAILAVAGRPNLDGEPFQGSLADFTVLQVESLRPQQVVFCHHDAWMPVIPAVDTGPVARALANRAPGAELVDLSYGDPRPLRLR